MAAQNIQLIADTGPFGPGTAGHSHADTLSLVLRRCAPNDGQMIEQILIDPGTYTYVADPLWRDRFRGTAAHNTLRIDGLDQAIPRGPFAWQSRPGGGSPGMGEFFCAGYPDGGVLLCRVPSSAEDRVR